MGRGRRFSAYYKRGARLKRGWGSLTEKNKKIFKERFLNTTVLLAFEDVTDLFRFEMGFKMPR